MGYQNKMGCCVFRAKFGAQYGHLDFQAEPFAKPKIKQEIITSVIPAQAGILLDIHK
ncbi:hypothetical protein [Kingella oralis]|uniref:hypothetical protein n=1 Tax=Kingella oralis TaxID=505 RepID=UPI002D7F78B2|nr:hypothetical protein [Kingella oralis]